MARLRIDESLQILDRLGRAGFRELDRVLDLGSLSRLMAESPPRSSVHVFQAPGQRDQRTAFLPFLTSSLLR